MTEYKAIFSDIDGTLLNTRHQVSTGTLKAVQKVLEKGIPFVLVSARMPKGMTGIRNELGSKWPMICYSGALVVNRYGEVMLSHNFEPDTAKKLCRAIKETKEDISISIYSDDRWMVEDKDEKWTKQESDITGVIPEEISFDDTHVFDCVHKYLCMGKPDVIERLEENLKKLFPQVRIYKSKPTYLEIMDLKASKSGAIENLEDFFHIKREEAIAFGDGFNDIDMLCYAGLGVAMGNASDEVKGAGDVITGTNDEEGLRQILEQYVL